MDAATALERMRWLLAPGGTLAVLGLARSRYPAGLVMDAVGIAADRWYKALRTYCEVTAPTVWPPPVTYSGMRRLAGRVLPGVRYRRHLLWRYSLVWTKPRPQAGGSGGG